MRPKKSKKTPEAETAQVEAPEVTGEVLPPDTKSNALAVVDASPAVVPEGELRGEQAVDELLLKEAAREVRRIQNKRGMQAVQEMGPYLLRTFFGGDLTLFKKRSKDHKTFRMLAESEGMPSYSWLYKAVQVAQLLPAYPAEVAEALSLSHHAALLPEHDPKKRAEHAQKAVTEGWTKRELEEEVRRTKSTGGHKARGRKPLPPLIKNLGEMARTLEKLGGTNLRSTQDQILAEGSSEEVHALLERIRTASRRLAKFVGEVYVKQRRRGRATAADAGEPVSPGETD